MKRALITGAADGIGRALAERLLSAGWGVLGVDMDQERAATLACPFVFCDLGREEEVAAALEELQSGEPFDLVVHNAGISCAGRFEETEAAQQQAVIDVNLRAPMLLTAGLLSRELVRQGGTFVFVSSLSHQVGYPSAAVYAATKDGLVSYARSLYVALGPQKIHVLTVFPGPVRTAHARRYAPEGSKESSRMPPDKLARLIEGAIENRKRVLLPGGGAKVFAWAGRWLPGLTERAMKKALYDPLT